MAYEVFIPKRFNPRHRALIDTADEVMRRYQSQGYDLSLRQLYYQFVAHHGLPNTEQNYKMLGNVISDARLAGELDWDSLVDRGRETISNPHWGSPANFLRVVAPQYRHDLWTDQEYHIEVMVEKQALEGVLVPVCRRLDVSFTANKGYSSSSHLYEIGQRLKDVLADRHKVVILYLGDHDPSGIDMTRDVFDRLRLFSGAGEWDEDDNRVVWSYDAYNYAYNDEPPFDPERFRVERIALNMDQVEAYNPPPNPAKLTDSRANSYVRQYGRQSWELDALDPEVLANLVDGAVREYMDTERWNARYDDMLTGRNRLIALADTFPEA